MTLLWNLLFGNCCVIKPMGKILGGLNKQKLLSAVKYISEENVSDAVFLTGSAKLTCTSK